RRLTRVTLRKRADLGLIVFGAEGGNPGVTGTYTRTSDRAFDAAFRVIADEPERARALLAVELRREMLAIAQGNAHLTVHDGHVEIARELSEVAETADDIAADVRSAVRIACLFADGLARTPTAAPLARYVEHWQDAALAHRLAFSRVPLA